MINLFRPSALLMNRLRYPLKFILIGIVCFLPLAVSMFFFQREINANIAFTAAERQGVVYARPLTQLLMAVLLRQQMMNAYLQDKSAPRDKILTAEQDIAQAMQAIDAVDKQTGSAFKTTDDWQKIKNQWQDLNTQGLNLTPSKSLDAHSSLANDIVSLITKVGNNSNLTLDPDVDSY